MKHRRTDRNPLPQNLRWQGLAVATLLVGMVLAACGQPVASQVPDQQAARNAALAAVDDAFAGEASADSQDAATANVLAAIATTSASADATALETAAVEPMLVIRRVAMHRDRHLLTLTYDGTSQPATATAEVAIAVTGTAQIWKVWPDLSLPRTLVGEKPIDLQGTITLNLERAGDAPAAGADVQSVRLGGGWRLTGIESGGFSQGANAATVQDVMFDPDPLLAGRDDNAAFVTLSEPSSVDDFLVAARSRHLRPHGVLGDAGAPPDQTASDDVYSGYVWVGPDARPGTHLAFVTALDYSRTVNLATTDGSYDDPYTDTVQPVLVDIAAGS